MTPPMDHRITDATVTRDAALPAITCGYSIDDPEGDVTNFVQVSVLDGSDYDSIITSYPDAEATEELTGLGDRAVRFIADDGPYVVISVDDRTIMVTATGGPDPGERDYGFTGITALATQIVEPL